MILRFAMPAKAGIHVSSLMRAGPAWTPAFAGVTVVK